MVFELLFLKLLDLFSDFDFFFILIFAVKKIVDWMTKKWILKNQLLRLTKKKEFKTGWGKQKKKWLAWFKKGLGKKEENRKGKKENP